MATGKFDGGVQWPAGLAWAEGAQAATFDALLKASGQRFSEELARDPMLRSMDALWNANPFREIVPIDWAEIARALRTVWMLSLGSPTESAQSMLGMSSQLWQRAAEGWSETARAWWGMQGASAPAAAGNRDKRFAAPAWQSNPLYRALADMYLLASDWLLRQGEQIDGLDDEARRRLTFHLRQFIDAMSPALLLMSNPAAQKRAMETNGASLTDGLRNLLDDLKAGRLSMVDESAFTPGRNLATTPGTVVLRNPLIELIQYKPTTETTHAVPLLILPPWINKYYVLDLQQKNSLIAWLVAQGFTVFVVSWKNPDASMEDIGFEEYMSLGPLAASDAVRAITGSPTVNVMGYCIGGTLLAMTLAWLAAEGDTRFGSATFMVSLQDFAEVGDTALFLDEAGIDVIERQMMERGYLDSRAMSNMFNLLRPNDLIWSNVVNSYLMGNKPPAFDLLYWNSDGTRMTRAAHTWYLRNTYIDNNLVEPGRIELKGRPIDLGRIALDVYAVGAEKDHIVPWESAWRVTRLLPNSRVRFVLASSGHIAGIINPPGGSGCHWVGAEDGAAPTPPVTPESWRQATTRQDGSWWTDWAGWLAQRSGERGAPPPLGVPGQPTLGDAPGQYVLEK